MAQQEIIFPHFQIGLKRARERKGYTQVQLAEIMKVTSKTVANWEQGIAFPTTEKLSILANVLNCDLDYLTGRIDEPTHDIDFIHRETGLSEKAIMKLKTLPEEIFVFYVDHEEKDELSFDEMMPSDSSIADTYGLLLSDMICSDYFTDFLNHMLETYEKGPVVV